jgi:GNAT superfamily N-acetyltransferase
LAKLRAVNVRLARREDVERVPVIERAAASLYAPFGLETALLDTATETRRIERAVRGGELLVATDDRDRAIGYALFAIFGRDLHLEELAVMPSHGRRGHGTALLTGLADVAASQDVTRITLVTLDFVPFGEPFYLARGFARLLAIPAYMASLVDPGVSDGRVALGRTLSE